MICFGCNQPSDHKSINNNNQKTSIILKIKKKNEIPDTNQIIQNLKNQANQYYTAINSCNVKEINYFLPKEYILKKNKTDSTHELILIKGQIYRGLFKILSISNLKLYDPIKLISIHDTIQTSIGINFLTPFLEWQMSYNEILLCFSYNKGQDWKFINIEPETSIKEIREKFPELKVSKKLFIPKLKRSFTPPKDVPTTIN